MTASSSNIVFAQSPDQQRCLPTCTCLLLLPAPHLSIVQVVESRLEEVAVVKEDLELKLLLWSRRDSFEKLATGWRSAQFDSLDVAAIEEVVGQ